MGRCRRHPHHSVVGVCAHCLNDRLLALMEEEEDEELMLHELYDMCPHAYNTYTPPYSCVQAGSFSKPGAPTPVLARRASSDYNRAHVKQMAASYLHKHHHSLSSSPQLHPSNAPSYTKPAQRPRPPFDTHPPFIAEEITRKKRPSLWSILLRHKDDSIASKRRSLKAYSGEHVHSPRDDYSGIMKVHHVDSRAEEISGGMKQRLDNSWKVDANISDGLAQAVRLSLSSSSRGRESSSRNASLLASPQFMASPSRQVHHHFPSPVSKYTPPSPLKNETICGDNERASPGRQVPVSYGLSGQVENYGVQDDDTSRSSWISSLFPRRHRRSKSISGSDAVSFSQASHLHSVGASPDSGPRGRRKSVSFLDNDMHESPSRYIAAKLSQSNGIGIGFKSPDMQRQHALEHLLGTKTSAIELKASKQLFKSPKGSVHGALCEHMVGQEHSRSRGRSVNELAVNLSSPTISKADSTHLKSPRAKLVSFLNKRKNGTVSIDCGRDARVSPVPMLRVKRDYLNHHDLHRDQDHDHPGHGGLQGLKRRIEHHEHGLHRHTEHHGEDSKFKEKFRKSSIPTDKETLKSPRLMSLHAMKQLLKSPKLAPVRTIKREPDEEDGQPHSQFTRSWSKAFSKTLSPMLGRKHKNKQSIRKQDFVHDGTQHGYNEHQQSDESPVNRGRPNVQYSPCQNGNHLSIVQKHRLQQQHGNDCNRGDELLVRETRVLPALDEKGPPHQYSFLSKDYSAFSFYFSPRRSGSIDSATRMAKKSSVW